MIGSLPRQLEVCGKKYNIRTDYRNCLLILGAFNDPDNTINDAYEIMLRVLYKELPLDIDEAIDKAVWFLNCGDETPENDTHKKPIYDWVQDEQMIFAEVNKVAGREVRADNYMHFWTFVGLFQGIGEGYFSAILSIRDKLNKNKPLDKAEKEFYRQNKHLIKLKTKLSKEEQEERDFINNLFD